MAKLKTLEHLRAEKERAETQLAIVSRFFRKNKSGHLVAGSQPAMISDSRSSSAFKR